MTSQPRNQSRLAREGSGVDGFPGFGAIRPALIALAAVHLLAAWFGSPRPAWWLGTYHFVHLNLATLCLALLCARAAVPRESPLHSASRAALFAFAIPVFVGTLLGALGLLRLGPVAAALDTALILALLVSGRRRFASFLGSLRPGPGRRADIGWGLLILLLTAGIFVVAAGGSGYWSAPPTHWDDHTYHLPYPAHWLHTGRLENLAIPRGDPSVPFYPLNGQILYFQAILPFGRTDFAVRLVPIAVLLAAALHLMSAAARLGARKVGLAVVPVLIAAFPFVHGAFQRLPGVRNSGGYGSDHMLAMFALAATAMLAGVLERPRWGNVACLGVALGLMTGTKFHGALLAPVLAALFLLGIGLRVIRSRSRRLSILRAGGYVVTCVVFALILGGFWYARNLRNTGNPVYPAQVRFLGRIIFPGPRTPELYRAHPYHYVPEFNRRSARAYLGSLWEAQCILAVVGCALVALRRRRLRHLPLALVPLLPFALLAAAYLGSPYRWMRFAYPAAMHLPLGAAVVAGALGGRVRRRFPFQTAWRGRGRRWGGQIFGSLALAGAAFLALGALLLPAAIRRYQAGRMDALMRVCRERDKIAFAEGWPALDVLTRGRGARVAMWSMNVFYPLFGNELQNDVFFVPRNGWTEATFYRWGSGVRNVSGEENDLVAGGLDEADRYNIRFWTENLDKLGVDYLFLGPDLRRGTWPVEWSWAEALVKRGDLQVADRGRNHVIYRIVRAGDRR